MRNLLLGLSIVFSVLPTVTFGQSFPSTGRDLSDMSAPEEKKTGEANPFAAIQKLLAQLEARLSALESKAAPIVAQGAPRQANWVGGAQDPFAAARDRQATDPFAPQAQAQVLQPAPVPAPQPVTQSTSVTVAPQWEYKTVRADSADISGANNLGDQGWEMFAVVQPNNGSNVVQYFRRPQRIMGGVRRAAESQRDPTPNQSLQLPDKTTK